MEVDNKLSLESVRQFLLDHGGRATQSELTDHFKELVSKEDTVKVCPYCQILFDILNQNMCWS